jgi:DNA repair exonuclease SbcCD ATPase subunit
VLSGANDRENIESYVAATLPEAARFTAKAVVAYMVSHVQTTRSGPRQRPLWLNKITVHNVLCFRDLSIGYEKLGLVLLKGINRDWPGQSNGAGKTSVLSMLPLIWFGQTLKGQKNDEWKQEDSDGEAWGVLTMRDERNRIIEIERGRPHRLLMRIDGKDVSAGVTGKGKTETQGRIEEETSFDYRTLISSVYIDQTVANGFLFGTQKDRMDLAGKLVDTSRFESAKQVVTKEIKTTEAASATAATRVEGHETLLSEIEDELAELKRQRGTGQWEARRKAAQKETARLRTLLAGYSASKEHYDEVERLISDAESELNQLRLKLPGAAGEVQSLLRELQRAKMLASSNKCTQCGQPVPKTVKAQRDTLQALYDAAALNQKKLTERQTSVQTVLAGAKKEVDHYHRSIERAETEKEAAELVVQQAMQGEKEEAAAFAKVDAKIAEAEHKAAHTRRLIKANQDIMQECDVQMEMLVYAGKAFSRTGIPMYLCRQMCDQLNQSADEYSEIFSEGRIQVQFSLDEDEFVATVVNSAGSAELSGQSVGESAMAGIITAFAIREAAPKTNLLILDEPGHGLDEKGQQLFATGLLKLKARWESIIVCTHSPVIQGILEGESTVWTVIKKNRVSRLKGL